METGRLMKDSLGEAAVRRIITALLAAGADFPEEAFYRDAPGPAEENGQALAGIVS